MTINGVIVALRILDAISRTKSPQEAAEILASVIHTLDIVTENGPMLDRVRTELDKLTTENAAVEKIMTDALSESPMKES